MAATATRHRLALPTDLRPACCLCPPHRPRPVAYTCRKPSRLAAAARRPSFCRCLARPPCHCRQGKPVNQEACCLSPAPTGGLRPVTAHAVGLRTIAGTRWHPAGLSQACTRSMRPVASACRQPTLSWSVRASCLPPVTSAGWKTAPCRPRALGPSRLSPAHAATCSLPLACALDLPPDFFQIKALN